MRRILKSDLMKVVAVAAGMWVMYMLLEGCCGGGEYGLAMGVVAGVAGGKHVGGEPLTLELSREASPDLLRNEIDERIVKIRPMATPIDQI